MIENTELKEILTTASDVSVVVEVYHQDAAPGAGGFDPADALACYASVGGIEFAGVTYRRLIKDIGRIKRTITSEINTASVTFANTSREISDFEFAHGFEGLILVIRLLSRSLSTALSDTQILFAGRCERPSGGDKESLTVTAKFVLGALDVMVPRRTFGPDDKQGRVQSDPEFEGFVHFVKHGNVTYSVRVKKGGFLGWWNKKTVKVTTPWSSASDAEATTAVPEAFGYTQLMGVHLGYADVGTVIQMMTAFCEGEIEAFQNVRSITPPFTISGTNYVEHRGLIGALNGPPNTSWIAPGNYSRTAVIQSQASNTAVDVNDPAPEVVAVIKGRKLMTPGTDGVWDEEIWTDNAAAVARYLITAEAYNSLNTSWIDDEYATECFNFNAELIFNASVSDYTFVEEG